jgi:hypothetical protein
MFELTGELISVTVKTPSAHFVLQSSTQKVFERRPLHLPEECMPQYR